MRLLWNIIASKVSQVDLDCFLPLVSEKEITRFLAEREQKESSAKVPLKAKADDFLDKYAKFFDVETTKADMKKDLTTKTQSQSVFTVWTLQCSILPYRTNLKLAPKEEAKQSEKKDADKKKDKKKEEGDKKGKKKGIPRFSLFLPGLIWRWWQALWA